MTLREARRQCWEAFMRAAKECDAVFDTSEAEHAAGLDRAILPVALAPGEQRARALDLWQRGWKTVDIAADIRVSIGTLHNWRRAYSWPARPARMKVMA